LSFLPNNYSYKRDYIMSNSKKIKTLILGASQAENCINPHKLGEGAFNLGGSGKPYYFDVAFVKENISKMPNLQLIIMTVAPFQQYRTYNHNISPDDDVSSLESYIRCMHLKYFNIHYGRFDYLYYLELPNSVGNVYSKITVGPYCDSLGYVPFDTLDRNPRADWRHNQLPEPIDYNNKEIFPAYKENLTYLKEMAMLCKKYNVRLVFVSIPYLDLAQQALPDIDMQGVYKLMDELKAVNPDIEYRNYIFDKRFNENDFYNSVHLAKEGADKFSSILYHDIMLNKKK